eukprot:914754-Ditylum_brightwellii.AAC.1
MDLPKLTKNHAGRNSQISTRDTIKEGLIVGDYINESISLLNGFSSMIALNVAIYVLHGVQNRGESTTFNEKANTADGAPVEE